MFAMRLTFPTIRQWLWDRGYTHYGKPFQNNAILSIVANPAYRGMPAWGKNTTGHYRQVFDKRSEKPKRRGRSEPKNSVKDETHFVFPREPVFDPDAFISETLWEEVHGIMVGRKGNHKPRPRTRNRQNHPLNGRVLCPDCGKPMVTGQATTRSGEIENYFICGTYAKTQHIECRANSVRWKVLDKAGDVWLERVKQQLVDVAQIVVKEDEGIEQLLKEDKANFRLMGQLFVQMLRSLGRTEWAPQFNIF